MRSFKFLNDKLNNIFISKLNKNKIPYKNNKGVVFYPNKYELIVENDILINIRNKVFESWQLICSKNYILYKKYMNYNNIFFEEELYDKEVQLCISKNYRPHRWKL